MARHPSGAETSDAWGPPLSGAPAVSSLGCAHDPLSPSATANHEPLLFAEGEGEGSPSGIRDAYGEDNSTFKILIATDTHLGYKGEDPVRGNDSFRTFEEILQIGRRENVDFMLHGGDLFDENMPSRTTLYRAMCLLRKYCFGSGTVQFDVLPASTTASPDGCAATQPSTSDKAAAPSSLQNKEHIWEQQAAPGSTRATAENAEPSATTGLISDIFRFGLNYLNENVNVCMPIFAMHGNHDDPGDASHLSPLDILEAAHLLAIYGMGWVRDERLHRAYTTGKVTYEVPADGEVQSWFNVLVVHQNMYKGGHGGVPAKNCVLERMLPSFADIVVWGHEHDCHANLRQSVEGRCQVLQPGSSIATSLTAGEAQQKHVFVLEVRGDCFRLRAVPLKTVRPLIVEDVRLADICQLPSASQPGGLPTAFSDPWNDATDREAWEALTSLVEDILRRYSQTAGIDLTASASMPVSQQHQQQPNTRCEAAPARRRQAYQLFCNYRAGATQDLSAATKYSAAGGPLMETLSARGPAEVLQKLPLVRVRVEHTGFSTISAPRFASQFVGRVANPDSLLCFYKRRSSHQSASKEGSALPELQLEAALGAGSSEIHDIIFHYMEGASGLNVLSEPDFNDAVQDFAVKMDPSAISAFVSRSISTARLHARDELLKRLKEKPDKYPSQEDARAIIAKYTQEARMRRLEAAVSQCGPCISASPRCCLWLCAAGVSGPPDTAASADAAPVSIPPLPTGAGVEMTDGCDPSDSQESCTEDTLRLKTAVAPLRRGRASRGGPPGGTPAAPLTSDTEEGLSRVEFPGASKKPRRAAAKKQTEAGRGRGRRKVATQHKAGVDAIGVSDSDSQDDTEGTQGTARRKGRQPPAAAGVSKQQMDIRSLLSQLSSRRGVRSQAPVRGSSYASSPPDVPTQQSDGAPCGSLADTHWEAQSSVLPTAAGSSLQPPAKRQLPPRPALPLGPPSAKTNVNAANEAHPDVRGPLHVTSWTKRAKHTDTQGFGGAGEGSESAFLPNSIYTGVSGVALRLPQNGAPTNCMSLSNGCVDDEAPYLRRQMKGTPCGQKVAPSAGNGGDEPAIQLLGNCFRRQIGLPTSVTHGRIVPLGSLLESSEATVKPQSFIPKRDNFSRGGSLLRQVAVFCLRALRNTNLPKSLKTSFCWILIDLRAEHWESRRAFDSHLRAVATYAATEHPLKVSAC
ncbi:uncharacterized protein LOC34622899 [Cyclospora cayetanensis]|uniref:Uncharacterized protein LOC34622899 n=1 Tax=Cyclospora cayetanensis TaxID=88456 RepID=A0A6P6S0L5_9EIME|nr:uncharacterized protein LOC34622899 [Cyclospora cayetanensis]